MQIDAPDDAVAPIAETEPADAHHPPSGCRFHPRCPIGPLVDADRGICITDPPSSDGHRHRAACHFAAAVEDAVAAQPERI